MSRAAAVSRPPLAWTLLVHEWRLAWRGMGFGAKDPQRRIRWPSFAVPVAFQLVLHALGLVALMLPRAWHDDVAFRVATLALLALLFTFMLSFAMGRVVTAFHERDDLDFLLAAPIPPVLVLFVRVGATALATWGAFAFCVYPFVDVAVLSGRFWMAGLYPLVGVVALVATAVALVVTDAVVRLIGTRRARVALQVFSALSGAAFYLLSQAQQFLPGAWRARLKEWTAEWALGDSAGVRFVGGLGTGDPLTWLVFVGAGVASFAAALALAERRFVAVARSPAATSRTTRATSAQVAARVARGFGRGIVVTLLVKEWRLVLRAPQLIAHVLLDLLYLVPLAFAAIGGGGTRIAWTGAAQAAGIVGLSGALASSLAWLAVSAEDSPDLVAGSPRPRTTILAAKLLAATIPPFAIVALVAAATASRTLSHGVVVLVYGALACATAALFEATSTTPGKRTDFRRRHKGRGFAALATMLQLALWAVAAGVTAAGWWLAGAAVTVVALAWPLVRLRAALADGARRASA